MIDIPFLWKKYAHSGRGRYEHEISDEALIKAREYHRKQKKAIAEQNMDTDNETKQTEDSQADTGADFMKKLMAAMEASQNQPQKHTVCVDVYAPSKEQAHAAVGMMLRTDATMFTLDELPYTKGVRVDWESLRMQDRGFTPDPTQLPLLMMMLSMMGRK